MEIKMTNAKAIDYVLTTVENLPEDVKEKLVNIKASYEKKATNRKPTATQVENEKFAIDIVEFLKANANTGYTITDIQKAIPSIAECSNQKISAIVRKLVESNEVTRNVEKGKAYFSVEVAVADEVEGE